LWFWNQRFDKASLAIQTKWLTVFPTSDVFLINAIEERGFHPRLMLIFP
jgi:hypothetical protein